MRFLYAGFATSPCKKIEVSSACNGTALIILFQNLEDFSKKDLTNKKSGVILSEISNKK